MRSVALSLVLLAAFVGANPSRLRRDEIVIPLEPAKSDSSLLELPEPGPISESELVAEVPVTIKSTESVDPLREEPSLTDELHVGADSAPHEDSESADEEAVVATTTPFFNLFDLNDSPPEEETVEVCNKTGFPNRSQIFCHGRLLEAVNLNHLFPDSKTFVDRPIKMNHTGPEIMADFETRFPTDDIDPEQLRAFVEQYFDKEGHELEKCEVPDWSPTPKRFDVITDTKMNEFAHKLNDIWKELCRRMNPIVEKEQERYSLIHVPHNFIAPGGRFREFYYWDTYWIVKGLLASGMYNTTRDMLENLGTIIDRHGFIPNGGRIYYLERSQPPLLTAMVYEYYEVTRDKAFVSKMMPRLEREYEFWEKKRNVTIEINGTKHTVFQYRTPANVPRPESYREDWLAANIFPTKGRKQAFYRNVGSAAESGWDFSTRWFKDHSTLLTIETTNIIPVDLNAFLCYNLNLMSFLHGETHNITGERKWLKEFTDFKVSFTEVFFKPEAKGWYDYNLREGKHNTDFFPSIAIPLFTGCYDQLSLTRSGDLLDKMEEMGAFNYPGGIPTSLTKQTQEQWDYPNGWSPLNHMVIEGMRKSDNPRLQKQAFSLAQKWVRANLEVFNADHAMWEKYNVETKESRGGGGEYEVQAGFGWSNGVVLDLLLTYGDRLTANETTSSVSTPTNASSPSLTEASALPIVTDNTTTTSVSPSTSALPALLIGIIAIIANWQ